jgi:hypothetical protein
MCELALKLLLGRRRKMPPLEQENHGHHFNFKLSFISTVFQKIHIHEFICGYQNISIQCVFFLVFPRRLVYIGQRFGTFYLFHLQGR